MLWIIIMIIVIISVSIYIYSSTRKSNFCNIENYNIDDLLILKRTPEYNKLISELIKEKQFMFTDEQIKILESDHQIYDIKDKDNIKNISLNVYGNCIKNEKETFSVESPYPDNLNRYQDKLYSDITNRLQDNIDIIIEPNCENTRVLENPKYLKNYYLDLYGNKIESSLSDYFANYYTSIDEKDEKYVPVNTLIGHSNFIIPDQYNIEKYFTNAYNVDWSRIINPLTYY